MVCIYQYNKNRWEIPSYTAQLSSTQIFSVSIAFKMLENFPFQVIIYLEKNFTSTTVVILLGYYYIPGLP